MNEQLALQMVAEAHGYTWFATRAPDNYIIQRRVSWGQEKIEIWRGDGYENMLKVLIALLS